MRKTIDSTFAGILARLAVAADHDEEEEIGRNDLASVLFHASPAVFEHVLNEAKRNDRLRRCLAAARYYSGLSASKCEQIDTLMRAPFPASHRRSRD